MFGAEYFTKYFGGKYLKRGLEILKKFHEFFKYFKLTYFIVQPATTGCRYKPHGSLQVNHSALLTAGYISATRTTGMYEMSYTVRPKSTP